MFCTALDSWRVEFTARHRAVSAIATTNAVRYVKKLRPSPAFCADVCRVCVSTSTWRTFRRACAMGLEGIVSKRKDSRYRSGRSSDWLKMKNPACAAVTREAEEDWS
jgi:ATP-dependent DNA ligase